MIGKKEWSEMAKQVDNLENRMEASYKELASRVNDPELKKVFTQLSRDERQHSKTINSLSGNILES